MFLIEEENISLQWFPPFHPTVQLDCELSNMINSSRIHPFDHFPDTDIRYTSQRQYMILYTTRLSKKINMYQLTTIDLRSNWWNGSNCFDLWTIDVNDPNKV